VIDFRCHCLRTLGIRKKCPIYLQTIVKIPMKDLYEKTMFYENKIKEAGYNLIVEWGT
jgi:hypothetical protein